MKQIWRWNSQQVIKEELEKNQRERETERWIGNGKK